MADLELAFKRSESNRRIMNVFLLVGLIASLAMAFPMIIGLKYALARGTTLLFFLPYIACFLLGRIVIRLRS